MTDDRQRYGHIDVARGIAILLVVLGHCCPSAETPLNKVLLSFHMPLFFFISGIFAKQPESVWEGVKVRVKRLLIPQLVLSVTVIAMRLPAWLAGGGSIKEFNYLSCFGYWFLPVLFLCSLAFILLQKYIDINNAKNRILVLTVLMVLITAMICGQVMKHQSVPIDYLIKLPVALLFYCMGNFTNAFSLTTENKKGKYLGMLLVVGFSVLVALSQINEPVKMYENSYGMFPLFLITSLLGIWVVMEISKKLCDAPFLQEMGVLSISVYVWNFIVVKIMVRASYRLLAMIGLNNAGVTTSLAFAASVMVLYVISQYTYARLPWLYGIRDKRKQTISKDVNRRLN